MKVRVLRSRPRIKMSAWSEWYHKNREIQYARIKVNFKRRRAATRKWLRDLKIGKCCVRCELYDYRVLEYHHRDPSTKEFMIAESVQLGLCQARILKEISKCDLLCANCHAIEHYEEV